MGTMVVEFKGERREVFTYSPIGRSSFDELSDAKAFKDFLGDMYLRTYQVRYPDLSWYAVEYKNLRKVDDMKVANRIEKTPKGYIVHIYDHGHCIMCELVDGKWQDCCFPTYEDALKAKNDYNEVWNS